MTEHSYTPGPWSVMPDGVGPRIYIISDSETFEFDGIESKQHVALTTMNYGKDTGSIRKGREEANARLIAAAPQTAEELTRVKEERDELVAALKDAQETIKALHGPVAWDIYDANAPEMKRLRAALSRYQEGDGGNE